MKLPNHSSILGMILLVLPLSGSAITVVECIDSHGNSSFRDNCPPEMSVKSTKILRGDRKEEAASAAFDQAAADSPVVLYSAPNCGACELVRTQLNGRNIPYTEKDATSDTSVQSELAAITGGPLTVPTVTVGEKKFTGYNHSDLKSALTGAGYP
ncbi:MAG: glutaredoxin family protein [Proteobacteria bacterium]|nr:glutaredoxin family protein [Pseudomonadota bacterium]